MRQNIIGLLAILLCLGQGCPSSFVGSSGNTGGTSTTDPTGTTDETTPSIPKGVPEGLYTGTQFIVHRLDNLSDAYPPQTQSSTVTTTVAFGPDGRLLRADGTVIALGDVQLSATPYGTLYEEVISITLSTNLTQYRTAAEMVMNGTAGLSWLFSGLGVHTYRLAGGQVLYDGQVEQVSDTAGGVSYELTSEYSANLVE